MTPKKRGNISIKSIPAFAKNLAYEDIVSVDFEDGEFHFNELIIESGHSVLHIVLFNIERREKIIQGLNDFNCGVNDHIANNYLVIDIPPLTTYSNIKEYLEKEESNGALEYEEACISKMHRARLA